MSTIPYALLDLTIKGIMESWTVLFYKTVRSSILTINTLIIILWTNTNKSLTKISNKHHSISNNKHRSSNCLINSNWNRN